MVRKRVPSKKISVRKELTFVVPRATQVDLHKFLSSKCWSQRTSKISSQLRKRRPPWLRANKTPTSRTFFSSSTRLIKIMSEALGKQASTTPNLGSSTNLRSRFLKVTISPRNKTHHLYRLLIPTATQAKKMTSPLKFQARGNEERSTSVHTLTRNTTPKICATIATTARAKPRWLMLAATPTSLTTPTVCVKTVTWQNTT